MHRFTRHILTVLLLHLSMLSFSQDNDYIRDTSGVTIMQSPPPEDAPSFSEITQQPPVDIKKVPAEKIEELKKDDNYWYANLEPEKEKEEQKEDFQASGSWFDQRWFRDLLWIIILCSFIGVVIWYLASSNISLFRRESKKITDDKIDEEFTDDIFSINYEKEIQKAVDGKNYRLAVRLWYLKTLKELSDRNIIDYRHERTNSEYVNSLFGKRYYSDFFRLTRNFEYTWYGQFNLSAEAYEMMRADFSNFKSSLS